MGQASVRTALHGSGRSAALRGGLLLLGAIAAMLWVRLAGGHVLYYLDTISYIETGTSLIERIMPISPAGLEAGGGGSQPLNLARSLFYALWIAMCARLDLLDAMVVCQAGLTLLMAWLVARVLGRGAGRTADPVLLTTLPLIAGALTALPFYVAYLMPDLMAPLSSLAAALLATHARAMRPVEIVLAWGIALLAGLVHLSHLAILALLLPVAAVISVLTERRLWWLPPALLGSTLPAAAAILALLAAIASQSGPEPASTGGREGSEGGITFTPFLTARVIADGPGFEYLRRHCPADGLATCHLYDALMGSDDPDRLIPGKIIFETDPEIGSYALLPEGQRMAIADEQTRFFLRVLLDQPVSVLLALGRNSLQQAAMVSVFMTLPDARIAEKAATLPPPLPERLQRGQMSIERGWIPAADRVHSAIYLLSIPALALLLTRRRPGLSAPARLFAVTVCMAILANAAICGGVSEPAARYGARMIWLLPYMAVFFFLLGRADIRQTAGSDWPHAH